MQASGESRNQARSAVRSHARDTLEFHRLAQERDLYAAFAVLCRYRSDLNDFLRNRFRHALGGDVAIEWVVEEALEKARVWAFRFDPERGRGLWYWLRRIGENCAKNRIERVRRVRTSDCLDQLPSREARGNPPLEHMRRLVSELPKMERIILTSQYRQHPFPDKRLAKYLGLSVGTIQNKRCKLLRRLRHLMRKPDES